MLKIAIILGSTRPHRVGEAVGRWVHQIAQQRNDAEFELVDIKDFNLPLLDEPMSASMGKYSKPHTRIWAAKIDSFDAYVFVTPEYNHATSGALKNAIDFLYREWNNKAAGFVGYGSTGGMRAVENLRLVMGELQVADVRNQVMLTLSADADHFSVFKPLAQNDKSVNNMLDQVIAWGGALKALREKKRGTGFQGRRVLVIGLSPEVNRSVVEPLQDLGIAAQWSTQPDQAGQRFNARDFELIVFGRGTLGPVSEQLKQAFSEQDPAIRFIDAIHPMAVRQTLAALAHDPRSPRFINDFRVSGDDAGIRVEAEVLRSCRLTLTIYRHEGTDVVPETLADDDVQPGHFEQPIVTCRLTGANSLLLSANEEEYHLHPFLEPLAVSLNSA